MSALGDRIVENGPVRAGVAIPYRAAPTAAEWNELREELIRLRALDAQPRPLLLSVNVPDEDIEAILNRAAVRWAPGEWRGVAPDVEPGGLRLCPVCRTTQIGPDLVECTGCAGREDAAAKRRDDR